MALDEYNTQVLLLHSQQSTLDTLSSGVSGKYSVHVATSGSEALNIFNDTPVHVIVSAQELPGMSGLDALREARKRSPETIGILLADSDTSNDIEALVGDEEVFQIVRGEITPEALLSLIDSATQRARLLTLSESANDKSANVDHPPQGFPDESEAEHIVMETSENGSTIISDGTGQVPIVKPQKVSVAPNAGGREVDVLVLSKDEEFLGTVKDSARGLHNVHHSVTPTQAAEIAAQNKVGVLVTDAAMVGSNIEPLTRELRKHAPRLVAVVAGRRDDGELLMDLINRGLVYRFLLKPVSPGRARLAIEASVKHHLEGAEKSFQQAAAPAAPAKPAPAPKAKPKTQAKPTAAAAPKAPAAKKSGDKPAPINVSREDSLISDNLDAFDEGDSFTETMTGIAVNIGKKIGDAKDAITAKAKSKPKEPPTPAPTPTSKPAAKATKPTSTVKPIVAPDPGPAPIDAGDGGSAFTSPKVLGIAAAAVAVIGIGVWMLSGSDSATVAPPESNLPAQPVDTSTQPTVAPQPIPAQESVDVEALFVDAESAILEQRYDDAAARLNEIAEANPENPRLTFLRTQLQQSRLRANIDGARAAIREGRFEEAGSLLNEAYDFGGAESAEVQALSEELAAARSAQQIDEVLQRANDRLQADQLIAPPNDNARYYYQLALSNDPDNPAARQGISLIASKLSLRARQAIDAGQLVNAEDLLRNARALDADNADLAAATSELEQVRTAAAAADAEAERAAAAAAEAERQAAANAEAERQAAAAEAQREADAEAARQAAEAQREADAEAARQAAAEQQRQEQEAAAVAAAALSPNIDNSPTTAADFAAAGDGSTSPADVADVAVDTAGDSPAVPSEPIAQQAQDAGGSTAPEMVPVSSLTRINYVAPKYPRSAQRRNVTGSVDVAFTILENGTVTDVVVLDSTPGRIFDQAAIDAVTKWRFEPPGPAAKRTAVRLAFNLE